MTRFGFVATLALAAAALPAAELPRKAPELAIKLTPTGEKLLSSMQGKVVVLSFISTTCPHCQALTRTLNKLRQEFGPKGVEVVGCAFNDMSNMLVADFIKQFQPNYPIGWQSRQATLDFLQHSPIIQLYVPIIVVIDKKGMIREQHLGDDAAYAADTEGNLRKSIIAALAAPVTAAPGKKATAATAAAKKS